MKELLSLAAPLASLAQAVNQIIALWRGLHAVVLMVRWSRGRWSRIRLCPQPLSVR